MAEKYKVAETSYFAVCSVRRIGIFNLVSLISVRSQTFSPKPPKGELKALERREYGILLTTVRIEKDRRLVKTQCDFPLQLNS